MVDRISRLSDISHPLVQPAEESRKPAKNKRLRAWEESRLSQAQCPDELYDIGLTIKTSADKKQPIGQSVESCSCTCNSTCSGCVQTDSGCHQTQSGCRGTDSRCGHTDSC